MNLGIKTKARKVVGEDTMTSKDFSLGESLSGSSDCHNVIDLTQDDSESHQSSPLSCSDHENMETHDLETLRILKSSVIKLIKEKRFYQRSELKPLWEEKKYDQLKGKVVRIRDKNGALCSRMIAQVLDNQVISRDLKEINARTCDFSVKLFLLENISDKSASIKEVEEDMKQWRLEFLMFDTASLYDYPEIVNEVVEEPSKICQLPTLAPIVRSNINSTRDNKNHPSCNKARNAFNLFVLPKELQQSQISSFPMIFHSHFKPVNLHRYQMKDEFFMSESLELKKFFPSSVVRIVTINRSDEEKKTRMVSKLKLFDDHNMTTVSLFLLRRLKSS